MKQWFKQFKRWQKRAGFGMTVVLVLSVLAAANLLAYWLFYRFDLTANKNYSLSPSSKALARELPDIVNIKLYFSGNLPSQYLGIKQDVLDLLDEYQNYSGGKIRVEQIDPLASESAAAEARSKGIPEVQFNVLEKDKYQAVNGYMGLVLSYGDKSEAVPFLNDVSNFEYLISSDIKKLQAADLPVIGVLSGHDSLNWQEEAARADQALSALYQVEPVDLKTAKEVPDKIKVLVVAGPKQKLEEGELRKLDAFVMRGGSLLLLVDGVTVGDNLEASKADTGLGQLLASYGLGLKNDLVLDTSSGVASFNQGFLTFNINYPFWPRVTADGFDQANPAVARLESLVLPWASSIEVDAKKTEGLTVDYLAKTSAKAWRIEDNFDLRPDQTPAPDKFGRYDLAVAVRGKLKSAFDQAGMGEGRVILVGDSDFIKDNLLETGDNLAFFQNAVDYLASDEQLISIRAKGVTRHPLERELSDGQRAALRYGNVFGMTALVLAFGLYRYYARRRKSADK